MDGHQTLDALDRIQVGTANGAPVPLGQISTPRFRTAPPVIQRHDRQRQVTVTAYPATGENTDRLTRSIVQQLAAMSWPEGYEYKAAGEVEAREESFSGLGGAGLAAPFCLIARLG